MDARTPPSCHWLFKANFHSNHFHSPADNVISSWTGASRSSNYLQPTLSGSSKQKSRKLHETLIARSCSLWLHNARCIRPWLWQKCRRMKRNYWFLLPMQVDLPRKNALSLVHKSSIACLIMHFMLPSISAKNALPTHTQEQDKILT